MNIRPEFGKMKVAQVWIYLRDLLVRDKQLGPSEYTRFYIDGEVKGEDAWSSRHWTNLVQLKTHHEEDDPEKVWTVNVYRIMDTTDNDGKDIQAIRPLFYFLDIKTIDKARDLLCFFYRELGIANLDIPDNQPTRLESIEAEELT